MVFSAYNFITTSFFPSNLADWDDLFVDKIYVGKFSFGSGFFKTRNTADMDIYHMKSQVQKTLESHNS